MDTPPPSFCMPRECTRSSSARLFRIVGNWERTIYIRRIHRSKILVQLRGSPPSSESNKGTQARLSSAKSARATPELYSQQKPCGFHRNWPSPRSSGRDGTSRLNSAGRTVLPSWLKKRVEEVCWWVTARRLVHLNPQNPPLQPHGSHLTANKAPTSRERSR